MLGDEQLLDQPQVGLDLLPQALRHEADPQLNTLVAPPSHSTKLMLPLSSTRH